jgi:hypothetical protein
MTLSKKRKRTTRVLRERPVQRAAFDGTGGTAWATALGAIADMILS